MAEVLEDALEFLEVKPTLPNLENLADLVNLFQHKIPWETASRILRKDVKPLGFRHRSPEEFWKDSIAFGSGGTCFDINGAFFELLKYLGYKGYLIINNVEGEPKGTHSSVVVELDGKKWLTDPGYPIYSIMPMQQSQATEAQSPVYLFHLQPAGNGTYIVTQHLRNLNERCFELVDSPVSEDVYRKYAEATYQADINLDNVRISKLVKNSLFFYKSGKGLRVISSSGIRKVPLSSDPVSEVARIFGMDEINVRGAHNIIGYRTG